MPALQVKDCPQYLYDELRLCASREDRSMSQQMLHILKHYISLYKEVAGESSNPDHAIFRSPEELFEERSSARGSIEKRRKALERIAELFPVGIPEGYTSVSEMIREDREGRSPSIESLMERD